MLFLGDSFVWGYDVEAEERFTEILRSDFPGIKIINAAITGYGNDQEYLLLRRLWNHYKPNVVVLIFCVDNDRRDNTSNVLSSGYYKPYLRQASDGQWSFAGYPIPKSRQYYFTHNWLVRNLWLARMAVTAYVYFRHPGIEVPDPTEHLVGMLQDFVQSQGGKFLIGLQRDESALVAFLRDRDIPYVSFDGAQSYPTNGSHWTPQGHRLVAERLRSLLTTAAGLPNFLRRQGTLRRKARRYRSSCTTAVPLPPERRDSFFVHPSNLNNHGASGSRSFIPPLSRLTKS